MWRIPNKTFASGCHHAEEDWTLIRHQLGAASVARAGGYVPPLAIVLRECGNLAQITRESGQLPFPGAGIEAFRSLSADIEVAIERSGPAIRALVERDLASTYDDQYEAATRGDAPPWPALLASVERVVSRLSEADAVVVAFDDLLESARQQDVSAAMVAITPRLDDLRGIAELQRRAWTTVQRTIEQHMTVEHLDGDGRALGGTYPSDTPVAEVCAELRNALRRRPEEREWAVWIGTLAGPAASHREHVSAAIGGPIAVSGIACVDDVEGWLVNVRAELVAAFAKAGLSVPADVRALGEPMMWRGVRALDGPDLWRDMASPPSFVSRVAVTASHSDEAVRLAREALRAVYAVSAPLLARDLRTDVVIWSPNGAWSKPNTTARGRGLGEIRATRDAARAVSLWAEDLGSPLDRDQLDLLRSRALVRDPDATAVVRLLRAFACLEGLTPAGRKLDHIADRLWARTVFSETHQLLRHLLDRVLDPMAGDLPADGFTWEDCRARRERLRRRLEGPNDLRWNLGLLDVLDEALVGTDEDCATPAFARMVRAHLSAPDALAEARETHAAAFRRARRHRNLSAHGFRLDDEVLAPTIEFLAAQLEYAVAGADEDGVAGSLRWLGSLGTIPDPRLVGMTIAELLAAVSEAGYPTSGRIAA